MKQNHSPKSALCENAHDGQSPDAAAADNSASVPALADSDAASPSNPAIPEDYDPADYRWVPVRRRPRYDGWTDEKQRRFIEVLADTGIVTVAAKAVGMSRESANRLRRSPHGAAFARAWDAAREHSGSALEDIAFERAIEGVEHNVFDEYGNVICTKRVYNDRLLQFLLRNLKPERYGRDAQRAAPPEAPATLDGSLLAMEPQLPAPVDELLDPDTLAGELEIADIMDGTLPDFLSEQRPQKSAERIEAEEWAATLKRGQAANEKMNRNEEKLTDQEFKDMCLYLDPSQRNERGKKRFR